MSARENKFPSQQYRVGLLCQPGSSQWFMMFGHDIIPYKLCAILFVLASLPNCHLKNFLTSTNQKSRILFLFPLLWTLPWSLSIFWRNWFMNSFLQQQTLLTNLSDKTKMKWQRRVNKQYFSHQLYILWLFYYFLSSSHIP